MINKYLNKKERKRNNQSKRDWKKEAERIKMGNRTVLFTGKSGLLTSVVVTARVNGHLMVIDNYLFLSHDMTAGLMNFHFWKELTVF